VSAVRHSYEPPLSATSRKQCRRQVPGHVAELVIFLARTPAWWLRQRRLSCCYFSVAPFSVHQRRKDVVPRPNAHRNQMLRAFQIVQGCDTTEVGSEDHNKQPVILQGQGPHVGCHQLHGFLEAGESLRLRMTQSKLPLPASDQPSCTPSISSSEADDLYGQVCCQQNGYFTTQRQPG
jgi:hypothetical protein